MKETIVEAPVTGSVWSHSCSVGQMVTAGSQIILMECMKMEIPVESPVDGEVRWLASAGTIVEAGAPVAKIG